MPKPKTTIPKPRKPPATPALDAFVTGADARKSKSPEVQTSGALLSEPASAIESPAKRERKQMTLYLSPEVARALKLHAVETEREMSEIAEEAIRAALKLPSVAP